MDGKLKCTLYWRMAASLAILAVSCSCSRPGVIPGGQGSADTEVQDASLQPASSGPIAELSDSGRAAPANSAASSSIHTDRLQDLPAGTLLTVRLKAPLYASNPSRDDSFEAVVEQAVQVNGQILIPKGAMVVGRVESAQISKIKPNRGYLRLVLQSVELGDHRIPVQTTSLFAHQAPLGDTPIAAIHLDRGRRLTFCLLGAFESPTSAVLGTH